MVPLPDFLTNVQNPGYGDILRAVGSSAALYTRVRVEVNERAVFLPQAVVRFRSRVHKVPGRLAIGECLIVGNPTNQELAQRKDSS